MLALVSIRGAGLSLQVLNLAQDTTSTTLTYMFWELARNPSWQDRLRKELVAPLPANDKMLPRFRELDDLPVLDAVINEALRLHPAAPASLQRETPVGGKQLDGYFIPEKVEFSIRRLVQKANVIRLSSRCSAILLSEIQLPFQIPTNSIQLVGWSQTWYPVK